MVVIVKQSLKESLFKFFSILTAAVKPLISPIGQLSHDKRNRLNPEYSNYPGNSTRAGLFDVFDIRNTRIRHEPAILVQYSKTNRSHFFQGLLLLGVALASGCASTPSVKTVVHTHPPVIVYALSLQGKPYRYGKSSPEEGFDCSGFIKHVYERQGIFLPRTTEEMAKALPKVRQDDLQSGDLIFFNINSKPFSHVGLYIDHNDFIHAPSKRTGRVKVSSLKNSYWRKRFIGIRRPYHYGLSTR